MDLQPAESVSISAFRSLHLSPRGSDHSRFVPNVCRVCRVSRQSCFLSRSPASPRLCVSVTRARPEPGAKLELIFVGGLGPRKACDLALRAAAPFCETIWPALPWSAMARSGSNLEQLVKSLGIEKAVSFCGWLSHAEVLKRLRSADVLVFPSLRDNGAGVVFEALAMRRRTCGRRFRRARRYRSSRGGIQGASYQ